MDSESRINALRAQIDVLDSEILFLLNKRAQTAAEVGIVKGAAGAPVYRPEREAAVIRRLCAENTGPLKPEAVSAVWREIMSGCRSLEEPTKAAYLGPEGTFSEEAMIRQFGSSVPGVACERIEEVFRFVETGAADFGVVPIENSTEGSVNRTMDCLIGTSLTIVAEVSIPIHQNLMTLSGSMEGITKIYSHPQSLGQCVGWLNQHFPSLERLAASSNAEAARIAAQDPTAAAIAGERAAELAGLRIVEKKIQDAAANKTRFVVLGKNAAAPSVPPGKDKTSLIFSLENVAGSLYHALKPLDDHGVSMTRFESRPAKRGTWEYYFYTDIEGHSKTPEIARALEDFRKGCAFFKNLGSYPAELSFDNGLSSEKK